MASGKTGRGYLDADLMWGGGSVAYGLPYVYVAGDKLYIGRYKNVVY